MELQITSFIISIILPITSILKLIDTLLSKICNIFLFYCSISEIFIIFDNISNIFPMEGQLLGIQLRNRRESLKLKQEDLAEMAGVTTKTLHLLESGQGNPSLSTINKIMGVLGLEFFIDIKRPD